MLRKISFPDVLLVPIQKLILIYLSEVFFRTFCSQMCSLVFPLMSDPMYFLSRMISKQFHYQLRNSEKQAFVGPPDNMREHVLAAAKALKVGDWKKCIQYLINPKMNQKVWNLFAETEKVKNMLIANAKKESLRVYLFSYSQFYDNISQGTALKLSSTSRPRIHSAFRTFFEHCKRMDQGKL